MIIKNLKSLLHRNPVAVLLYFTGLVGAFVAFTLIILQAEYELSFDKCHPAAEQTLFRNVLPRGFVDDVIGSGPLFARYAQQPFRRIKERLN